MKTTDPTDAPSYSIGELARRGGVSRRTVRYYVQRGLLPSPEGTGRGSRYTERHLRTLIRIRELQEAGVPLAEVRGRLREPAAPAPAELAAPFALPWSTWTRVVLRDGVELHLKGRRLGPEQLRDLMRAVHDIIDQGDEK